MPKLWSKVKCFFETWCKCTYHYDWLLFCNCYFFRYGSLQCPLNVSCHIIFICIIYQYNRMTQNELANMTGLFSGITTAQWPHVISKILPISIHNIYYLHNDSCHTLLWCPPSKLTPICIVPSYCTTTDSAYLSVSCPYLKMKSFGKPKADTKAKNKMYVVRI